MRKPFSSQQRLDCHTVLDVPLNLECRDEIIALLRALQHIYSKPALRDEILRLIAGDVNKDARDDCGRDGLDYWQILVLAAVRLGCNLDYDKLQDLAEQHRALRHVMGIGDWDGDSTFSWRRIRDNLCLVRPTTIERISHAIVAEGHRLQPDAAKKLRADSFVVETNIHYPSESSLIRDGLRKIIEQCVRRAAGAVAGWRQHEHLLKKIEKLSREIERIASRKGPNYEERLKKPYRELLRVAKKILARARAFAVTRDSAAVAELSQFIERTEQVCGTARRRVLKGETVPNADKLFSIFEPHTQLYQRGKAGEPIQFGRLVLVYEDVAGFITHHHVLPRDAADRDVIVEQTRVVQQRLGGKIEEASFDRGFHTPENQEQLATIVAHPCLPKLGKQGQKQEQSSVRFRRARQRHPGVESAIGALQAGNGLERCRDRSELGFDRFVSLGVLGRNLQVLGKLLIAREASRSEAAHSLRQRTAA
jgi:Arc/MetJ-type ribon-helix-helix transcriptional regulator